MAFGGLAAFLSLPLLAQTSSNGPSETVFAEDARQARDRITRERAALEAGFDAEERACRARFFVNHCLQDLAPRRREALSRLREQELQLEEAERARRQAAALARTAHKQEDVQQRPPLETPDQAAIRLQREQALRDREQAEREAQASERVEQQRERERAAAERQRAREEAARGRARRGDSAPLPTPGGDGPPATPAAPAR